MRATGLDVFEDLGEFFEEGAGLVREGEGGFLFDCEVEGVEDCGEV